MAETPQSPRARTTTGKPPRASDGHDLVEGGRQFSPVCALCYWWAPTDRHACAAYPAANSIPDVIWNGADHHTSLHTGDHGVLFVLHPDAKHNPHLPQWARDAVQVGSAAEQAMRPAAAAGSKIVKAREGQQGKESGNAE